MVFAFVREPYSPTPGLYFSLMTRRARWKTNEVGFPNFSSDFCINEGFWSEAFQMAWSSLFVNPQLKNTSSEDTSFIGAYTLAGTMVHERLAAKETLSVFWRTHRDPVHIGTSSSVA
ncbi:hypothetical protein AVEN_140076-1 [Araneus ventricosus]|uniref:Uncharacterized protein n=1 Tax=Araneus ventricosus TaxID=182803 RepID=A0A4Y2WPZ0_ARAVE|nr:hypothetical protein AVEN_244907-1 [Araneus ventricosus]GBO39558.1 hypothetical protein AVEN_268707-1 [Araneus ventricosus]GBO39562.1 hypothetical protein AVEN_24522-1 [Araneus ventricosus]GBO39565.1 hypothetical protein AVEN_140076-1 [Araneus ventricosus]